MSLAVLGGVQSGMEGGRQRGWWRDVGEGEGRLGMWDCGHLYSALICDGTGKVGRHRGRSTAGCWQDCGKGLKSKGCYKILASQVIDCDGKTTCRNKQAFSMCDDIRSTSTDKDFLDCSDNLAIFNCLFFKNTNNLSSIFYSWALSIHLLYNPMINCLIQVYSAPSVLPLSWCSQPKWHKKNQCPNRHPLCLIRFFNMFWPIQRLYYSWTLWKSMSDDEDVLKVRCGREV